MVKAVKIRIHGGKISADFEGFVGRECERLEDRIRVPGLQVEEQEAKPELYQQDVTQHDTQGW